MADRNDKRLQIVTLARNTSKSMREIAADLGIHHTTVSRTIARYNEEGDFKTQYENCGRKSIFDERDKRHIRALSVKSPRASAAEIQRQVGAFGDCSLRTFQRVMLQSGIKVAKPSRRPYITDTQKARRLEWAHEHRHWTAEDWSRVIWSDETMVAIQDNCRYVRIVDGQPLTPDHHVTTYKHPLTVMIWACFAARGTGRCCLVEGRLNTEYYLTQIVDRRIVQQVHEWFPDGDGLFQQDNAPAHVSRRARAHFVEKGVPLLQWPPASPDLNPIENLWSLIKRRIRTSPVTTKQQLITKFLAVWHHDPEIGDLCKKLVDSMPARIEACIAAKGDATKY